MIVSSSPSLSTKKGSAVNIEDVFSTYLYTGNGSTQDIVNGINLADDGGMVWIKSRSNANLHLLYDTDRGALNYLLSSDTQAESSYSNSLTGFNTDGFTVGSASDVNLLSQDTASWTFKEQPRFFDMVKYTGNGVAGREIAHNLGCEVGMMTEDITKNWPFNAKAHIIFREHDVEQCDEEIRKTHISEDGFARYECFHSSSISISISM